MSQRPEGKIMDFTKFDTAASASEWMHLEIDKAKLYWDGESITLEETDAPCRVKLKGVGSNEVFAAFEKYQHAEMTYQNHLKKARAAEIDEITKSHSEKAEGLMDDLIVVACEDWQNIYFDGEVKPMTPTLIRKMIDRKDGYSKRSIRMFLFKSLADRRANLTAAV